jgi:hypothetical protein
MRDGGRARSGIVTAQRQHASVGRGARVVGVLEGVAGAIDARPLPVPDSEDPVGAWSLVEASLLRAPHRGGGEVLVHTRFETDAVLLEVLARTPQGEVVGAERRSPVAGDEAGRIETRRLVALALHQGKAHQRLDARQVDAARAPRKRVLERVAEIDFRQGARLQDAVAATIAGRV